MRHRSLLNKVVVLISCLFLFPSSGMNCRCSDTPAEYAMEITQFGITWYFDREYQTGRFANGDYWVIGPVTIVFINPPSVILHDGINKRIINGSMINPSPRYGNVQGYDNAMAANEYNPGYNAARPGSSLLSEDNPLVIQPGSSLISAESIEAPENRPQLKTAAILTVLASPAPEGSFRPPYCGSDKTIRYNVTDLNFSLLSSLTRVESTPDMTEAERYFERPWIDHIPGWSGGLHHPEDNLPNYGREISALVGIGALMLHLDFTPEEKQTLLIRYVQVGIDLFGVIQDGGTGNWAPDGGHASGRKWPILFAGLILSDAGMTAIGQKSGDYLFDGSYGPGSPPPDYIHFGEDGQTFYVTQEEVDRELVPNWEDITGISYVDSDIGMPEWGIRYSTDPGIDNKDWTASYRLCCTALAWNGFVLAAHIMDALPLWNHNALFDYMYRYMAITSGAPDPFGFTVPNEAADWRSSSAFTADMWDAYRSDY